MKNAIIVEDNSQSQAFFADILNSAFPDIAIHTAPTITEAERLLQTHCYNLALVDISLPDGSGINLLYTLTEQCPQTFTLVISIYDDEHHVLSAMKAGAQGYVLKEQSREDLIRRIRGISVGEPPFTPSVLRKILRSVRKDKGFPRRSKLSERETEVLVLLAKGLQRMEIAAMLTMSDNTVAGHIKSIYKKLNVSSRAEATLEAVRIGLVATA
ncbi:MAG: response regulator transcription factor [Gammaproteobacteria bacterium]|nr:response regulator transcription factor [Gammaproteobacteria bacterium]